MRENATSMVLQFQPIAENSPLKMQEKEIFSATYDSVARNFRVNCTKFEQRLHFCKRGGWKIEMLGRIEH